MWMHQQCCPLHPHNPPPCFKAKGVFVIASQHILLRPCPYLLSPSCQSHTAWRYYVTLPRLGEGVGFEGGRCRWSIRGEIIPGAVLCSQRWWWSRPRYPCMPGGGGGGGWGRRRKLQLKIAPACCAAHLTPHPHPNVCVCGLAWGVVEAVVAEMMKRIC